MRHTYLCPLRWADLDELGHVNNVVYVDYLQEARVELLRLLRPGVVPGSPDEAAQGEAALVVRHDIDYLTPLVLDRGPLHIEVWVSEVRAASFTLRYELFHPEPDGADGARRVYARATTLLTPYVFASGRPRRLTPAEREVLAGFLEPDDRPAGPRPGAVDAERATAYELRVRFSDVDVYRHVNNVKYVEYLQEARIAIGDALWRDPDTDATGVVVGRAEVDYHRPMVLRPEHYTVLTTVSRLGTRSMDLSSEIRDGDEVCARGRVVMVFFDREHGRSVEPSARLRARLEEALARGRAY
ncbi:Long-chain acyl-CoA thioesterase FadM [Nocardioides aquaticus]|uniref:Long-chain acyl-CoA thioesterase FadM n=1 Tax=Nocardioides aquaticus TaxID=160826 RepID=A0ABX8EKD5_9ACTN|nr:thioesterase family protein [Nocardioides aquaticus]QVT80997.1 Long-chain acyl-CoA thioesterase FadM [Nocardioides aquaticus]